MDASSTAERSHEESRPAFHEALEATTRSPDGLLLRYAVAGFGQPLVLLHPFSDALESWWDIGLAGRLARRFRVIAIDARGHGGSEKPRESARHGIDHRVADVVAVLDAAGSIARMSWAIQWAVGQRSGSPRWLPTRLRSLVDRGRPSICPGPRATAALARWGDGAVVPRPRAQLGRAARGMAGASDTQRSRRAVRGGRRRPDRSIDKRWRKRWPG